MTRKDSEKDPERPHYYSQFWLDVAAGRRIIGTPRTNEEDDLLEPEPEPVVLRKVGRNSKPAIAHPVIEPAADEEEEEFDELDDPEYEVSDVADEIVEEEELELPAIIVEEAEIPDMEMDLLPVEDAEEVEVQEPELEEEEVFEADEEEEEEEEEDWTARGRKKPKPGRQVKLPSKKPTKREPRRGF
jgi:hypothetical protein